MLAGIRMSVIQRIHIRAGIIILFKVCTTLQVLELGTVLYVRRLDIEVEFLAEAELPYG